MKLITVSISLFICLVGSTIYACTTIVVGSQATNDGSIIIARNNDSSGASEPKNMHYAPSMKAGTIFKSNLNNLTYKYPEATLPYTSFPIWNSFGKDSLSYEQTGINSCGVALTATETIFSSDKVLKFDPYLKKTGLTEDSITNLILPQAKTAKDGIILLGQLIEKYGSGEGFGVAISDKDSVWYLENAGGHGWLAQRVPVDTYLVSANQGRFQTAELNNPENCLYSPNLLEFAKEHKLYDPAKEKFNFFKCYTKNDINDTTYNYPRVEYVLKDFSNYTQKNANGLFPVFMKPTKQISVDDVKVALRNHYNGTKYDPYTTQNPREVLRPISVIRTALSHIVVTRNHLPKEIANLSYIAEGMPTLSPYIPLYQGLEADVPKEYTRATEIADSKSIFWKNRKLQSLVFIDFPKYAPIVTKAIKTFEDSTFARQQEMENEYLQVYKSKPEKAKKLILKFTSKTLKLQNKLLDDLSKEISKSLSIPSNLSPKFYESLIIFEEAMYKFHGA